MKHAAAPDTWIIRFRADNGDTEYLVNGDHNYSKYRGEARIFASYALAVKEYEKQGLSSSRIVKVRRCRRCGR